MQAASVINFIAFFWFTQFIFGCQHFIIAGTICKWYFTRDKTKLYSPIATTFSHLLNFHLGSVCMGSMLITLVKILRMIVNAIQSKLQKSGSASAQLLACFCGCIINLLERLLKYLVRNAYIIVAKDGTPFIKSAMRASDLLLQHIMDVIALNNFGDMVLVVGRIFVTVIAGLVGYALLSRTSMSMYFVPLIIGVVLAFFIVHCFLSVFEMTVDTIFICFCIDCEENDGITRPYFMSAGLRKIMIEMKAAAGNGFVFGPEGQFVVQSRPAEGLQMVQVNQTPVMVQPALSNDGVYDGGNSPYPAHPSPMPMPRNYAPINSNPSDLPEQQNFLPYSSETSTPYPPAMSYPQAPYGTAAPYPAAPSNYQ
jgi:hypothetical protein